MILIGVLVLILLGFLTEEPIVFLSIAVLAAIFLLNRSFKSRLTDLQQQLDLLKQKLAATETEAIAKRAAQSVQTAQPVSTIQSEEKQPQEPQPEALKSDQADKEFVIELDVPDDAVEPEKPPRAQAAYTAPQPSKQVEYKPNKFDELLGRLSQLVVSYFTDGNIFVRVGLLVLFFGVAFLLKYAAENSHIPVEFRFLGAAAGGFALVFVGWRLRLKKEIFALLLQGGGIGIIYITIFAAHRFAGLIPSSLTFVLLVAFTLITTALAVLQNSRSLAMYAVLGGFLAPILVSSNSGNYIGLFSYYAALNLVVFAVAWFKSWRLLNIMSFVFTFGVYGLWFASSYREEMLLPAGLFLLLFFVMYSVLGVLYALKQEQNLKGIVDGTLVFGTPLICTSIGMVMLRHLEYGIAIASISLGIYYVVLARFLWSRIGEQTRLLAESMLSVGVVFMTLAIPYALDGNWTSATWALEAAGILWVSLRQKRFYAQIFAIVLQAVAGAFFILKSAFDLGDTVWMNPAFLGGSMIALGSLISARLLYQEDSNHRLQQAHWLFYAWGLGWWLVSSVIQIDHYIDNQVFAVLLLLIVTASLLMYVDRIRQWNWLPASYTQAGLLPVLYFTALVSWQDGNYFLQFPDLTGWVLALALNYFIVFKLEDIKWPRIYYQGLYSGFFFLVVCMLSVELNARFYVLIPGAGDAWSALLTVLPLFTIWWVRQGRLAVLQRFGQPLQLSITALMVAYVTLWVFFNNFSNDGSSYPLPFIPLLNPVDLVQIVFTIAVLRSMKLLGSEIEQYKNIIYSALGGLAFIWVSTLFLRSMHHYMGIPFNIERMLLDNTVQTGLSILWTLIGMLAILYASRKSMRPLWVAGAILIGIVIVKLIFADLRASGTIERIISFLAVGGLLVAMGYFSPIPPKKDDESMPEKNQDKELAGKPNE